MANPFGSGSAIVMPLTSRARERQDGTGYDDERESVVRPRTTRPAVIDAPETLALVGKIVAAVANSDEGMTALEMRIQFNERPDRLQKALAAALRAKRIRRSGSRCQTRYLANR